MKKTVFLIKFLSGYRLVMQETIGETVIVFGIHKTESDITVRQKRESGAIPDHHLLADGLIE